MADGSVVFTTELDSSGLKNALSGLGRTAGNWAAGAGKTMVAGLGAVSAGLVVLGKKAFDYYTTMETYQTNFGVMLGDESAAMQHVADLRQMAADTPFGMDDLANASQTLQAFGMNADDTMVALQRLGDISLGNKDRMQGLTLALAQVSSAGKLTGNDLMQMVNAGFNPLQTIAERTGVSIGDLKDVMGGGKGSKSFQKAVKAAKKEVKLLGDEASEGAKWLAQIGEEGMISADMVGKAMEAETSEGGRFYNGMKKASETITGMLSTLEDDFSALVGDVFTPLIEGFGANVIPLAQGYLQDLTKAFTEGGTDGLVTKLGEVIGDAATKLALAIPSMASVASGILSSISKSLLENKDDITNGLSNAITAITESELPQTLTTTLLTLGGSVLSSVVKGVKENAGDIITGITNGLAEYLTPEKVTSLATDLVGAATAIVNGIADNLPTVISTLGTGLLTALGNFFSEDSLTGMATAAGNLVKGLLKGLIGDDKQKGALSDIGQKIIDEINLFFTTNYPTLGIKIPAFSDIAKAVNDLVEDIQKAFTVTLKISLGYDPNAENPYDEGTFGYNAWEEAGTVYQNYHETSWGDWWRGVTTPTEGDNRSMIERLFGIGGDSAGSDLQTYGQEAAGQYTEGFRNAVKEGSDVFETTKTSFQNFIRNMFAPQTDVGEEGGVGAEAVEALVVDMTSALENMDSALTTSVDTLLRTSASSADTSGFEAVGAEIPAGMAAGVLAGEASLLAAITSIIDSALARARQRAQINSPSGLFRDNVGVFLVPGIAEGVDNTAYILRASMQNAIDNAADGVIFNGRSIASRILSGGSYGSSQALRDAMSAATINQTNNFNVPVQTPDEFANTMFLYSTYGLDARG